MIWSHGLPLMKLDNKLLVEAKPRITGRLGHFSVVGRQPAPVSEGNWRENLISNFNSLFQMNFNTKKFVILPIGLNIDLV